MLRTLYLKPHVTNIGFTTACYKNWVSEYHTMFGQAFQKKKDGLIILINPRIKKPIMVSEGKSSWFLAGFGGEVGTGPGPGPQP